MGEVRACVPTHGIMRKEKAFLMNNLYTFAYMRKDLNGSRHFSIGIKFTILLFTIVILLPVWGRVVKDELAGTSSNPV